jgi:hypothetical protein
MLNFTGKVEQLSTNLDICPRLYHIIGVILCNMYQAPALDVFRNVVVSTCHLIDCSFLLPCKKLHGRFLSGGDDEGICKQVGSYFPLKTVNRKGE